MPKVRVRSALQIRPNLRQIRVAMGWSVQEAADYLRENAPLIYDQEIAGVDADPIFLDECARNYLKVALARARKGDFPSPANERGVTRVRLLFTALGLDPLNAGEILRGLPGNADSYLDGRNPTTTANANTAWIALLDWAARNYRRSDTKRAMASRIAADIKRVPAGFTREQIAETVRLADAGRLNSAEAERAALKLLGHPGR